MNRYIIKLLIVLGMVFIMPGILSLGIKYLPVNPQPPLKETFVIHDTIGIHQKFLCSDDNLSAIGFTFKNPNLENKKEVILTITEKDQEIRRAASNGKYIGDGAFMRFSFPPIKECLGKELTFSLSSKESSKEEGLEVFMSETNKGEYEALRDNDPGVSPSQLTLDYRGVAYVLYTKPINPLSLTLDIYRGWASKFFSDLPFAVFYLIVVMGLFCMVIFSYKQFFREK